MESDSEFICPGGYEKVKFTIGANIDLPSINLPPSQAQAQAQILVGENRGEGIKLECPDHLEVCCSKCCVHEPGDAEKERKKLADAKETMAKIYAERKKEGALDLFKAERARVISKRHEQTFIRDQIYKAAKMGRYYAKFPDLTDFQMKYLQYRGYKVILDVDDETYHVMW